MLYTVYISIQARTYPFYFMIQILCLRCDNRGLHIRQREAVMVDDEHFYMNENVCPSAFKSDGGMVGCSSRQFDRLFSK